MPNFIDKVKNYNQVILAIAGTVCVMILIFCAILLLIEMSNSWSRRAYHNDGILATEKTDLLNKDSLRKQIISFSRIEVVDSINQLYVLPVTQANLDDEEKYDDIIDYKSSSSKLSMSYYSRAYNNLLLYDAKTKSSEIIFNFRLSISDYFLYTLDELKLIVITASINDTNEDGLLNDKDFQSLFIYDLSKQQLFELNVEENYTILNALVPAKSNQLIAHFGIDRNHNNRFDIQAEPKVYYDVDFNTMSLNELIAEDQLDTLQKLLEGR